MVFEPLVTMGMRFVTVVALEIVVVVVVPLLNASV
jgi:hypothetical protein